MLRKYYFKSPRLASLSKFEISVNTKLYQIGDESVTEYMLLNVTFRFYLSVMVSILMPMYLFFVPFHSVRIEMSI